MRLRTILLLAGALLALLLLTQSCTLWALFTREHSWPRTEGALEVEGLEAPVRILRDPLGVPHVRARSEADAWFGLGFVHAQDRLFQADLQRRLAFGGVAEWFGEEMLELDGFLRGLDLESHARRSLEAQAPETRRALAAYARGMNAGAASLEALPIEYRLVDATWAPWRPHDALALTYLNSWFLSMNPIQELEAFLLRAGLERETADLLLRADPEAPPLDAYWDDLRRTETGPFTPGFSAFMDTLSLGDPSASNNWVLDGRHTADGKPLVANDPHLMQRVPSVWYLADVAGGALHVAGGTMPGFPFVFTGHTETMAWGLTNVVADYVDFAVVERRGEGYVLEGRQRPLEVRTVQVPLPEGRVVERTVPWTDVGPVVTDPDAPHVLALRWSAFELEDRSPELLHRTNRARTVAEVLPWANLPAAANQNFVGGDAEGHIAWAVTGVVPRRRDHTGRVPYLASRPGQGWDGWLEDLPAVVDPPSGRLWTANARPDHPLADAMAAQYIPSWRHRRIGALLSGLEAATPRDMHRLQLDLLDTRARARLPGLLEGVRPETDAARRCLALLEAWDFVADTASPGPTVWAALQEALLTGALADHLGEAGLANYFDLRMYHESLIDRGLDRFVEDRAAAVARALDAACARLEARHGPDPAGWAWGAVHALHLKHPFSDESPLLDWDLPRLPWPGTVATVAQSGFELDGEDRSATWIASLRMVTPLSDPGRATAVYPGGQSGQPGHPLYDSHFEAWRREETLPLYFDEDDVAARAEAVLVLRPAARRDEGG